MSSPRYSGGGIKNKYSFNFSSLFSNYLTSDDQTYGRAVDRSHKLEIKLRAKRRRRRRRTERREKINDVVVSDPGLS